jgi:hypothetical protein
VGIWQTDTGSATWANRQSTVMHCPCSMGAKFTDNPAGAEWTVWAGATQAKPTHKKNLFMLGATQSIQSLVGNPISVGFVF